ncbi:ATP-binding cassette domain-containing protein [Rhizobium leguminosarum bv. viciae]|nr:ATP-binding cassette domain-containing protein [Rhizobium leguminosarum bv. viciae]TCA00836.1 ATP-binding cassette domain-containing protein [Rhizobium leguminosarum bv. viciae]
MSFNPVPVGDLALEVKGVSKAYRLFNKPSDRLKQIFFGSAHRFYREHVALKKISFEVKRGETVGIVGRNGAGKSTLLQIITGTLPATDGEVLVHGRIAALLELGAGINPVFSGRENIGLLCAILGLNQEEIEARTPDIITFAGLDEYIDQPVKTYSSGMYVRLAFAIATCVDPDILIVDEALSVGDVSFRNKCMARLNELRASGVTVLFVSHDLSTLQMICDWAIWIEGGEIRATGGPVEITQEFHAFMMGSTVKNEKLAGFDIVPQHPTENAEFTSFRLRQVGDPTFAVGDDVHFEFALRPKHDLPITVYAISIYRKDGEWMIGQTSHEQSIFWPPSKKDTITRGSIVLKGIMLAPGEYVCCIAAYSEDMTLCFAMTELNVVFRVRSGYPTWGRIVHPIEWRSDV